MAQWSIDRIRPVEPTPGTDCEAAFAVHLDEGAEPQIVVEYVSTKYASVGHTRRIVKRYLDDETLPRRILVDREGKASPR